jgi:hypothetical protein
VARCGWPVARTASSAFDRRADTAKGQVQVGEQHLPEEEKEQDSQRDVQTLGGTSMIEAMKQALEFFESGNFVYPTKIATDLRQAIAELESQEQNFCPRCGKRTNDIHTCTPPRENT